MKKDLQEAERWYRKAAESNHRDGQYGMGWMYWRGPAVPRDDTVRALPHVTREVFLLRTQDAVKWWRLSAENGHTTAMYVVYEWRAQLSQTQGRSRDVLPVR